MVASAPSAGSARRRRAYIEHLYFALHLHAFLFLVLLVGETTELTATRVDDSWRLWFFFASMFVYGTGARFAAVFAMYFIVAVLVLFVTFVVATLSM